MRVIAWLRMVNCDHVSDDCHFYQDSVFQLQWILPVYPALLASIFKDHFKCKQILDLAAFTSFVLQLFTVNRLSVVLIAVIYCPPKHDDDFTSEFADYLSSFTLQYERILIVGDFNFHICCEESL